MKNWLLALTLALGASLAVMPDAADAKRLGGGKSTGMQRSTPDAARSNPQTPPSQATNPGAPAAAAAPGAAAAAPKRSWAAPLAGLAAGLGLAALASHFGFGEQLANIMTMVLVGLVVLMVVGFIMRRMAAKNQPRLATAGGPSLAPQPAPFQQPGMQRSALAPAAGAAPAATAAAVPADFDADGFVRIAKTVFMRMQEANDRNDLDDLRRFTTPEMFAAAKMDIQERGGQAQSTDVLKLDAEVAEVSEEGGRQVVSVRFHGLVREEREAAATDLNELWHLVREGNSPEWRLAGIQPL